ncbi:hypothetical protein HK105_200642 [Polyrhizophydium stewartii]|uniref:Uncharacterized protein n=1 Tax=Polyrhizophydium stewartii TaxID=2732419 RepID=A0ABR4NJP2_9FUNG
MQTGQLYPSAGQQYAPSQYSQHQAHQTSLHIGGGPAQAGRSDFVHQQQTLVDSMPVDVGGKRTPYMPLEYDGAPLQAPHAQQSPVYLGGLLLGSNLVTLVFTVFPVLVTLPDIDKRGWYVGDDVVRLLEPIVSLPFQLLILLESRIFTQRPMSSASRTALIAFLVSAAIYQQGAGFHSASNMFKHAVQTAIAEGTAGTPQYQLLLDIKSWIRDTWEHLISHYMYAVGGILISFVNAYAFSDYVVHDSLSRVRSSGGFRAVWIANTLVYGLIIGSVAIEFPKGSIVALALVVVYGFGVIGSFLYRREALGPRSFGRLPVLQSYFWSYVIALVIIAVWVGKNKGFASRNES